MPYVKTEMREQVDQQLNDLIHAVDLACTDFSGPGEVMDNGKIDGCLNYVFTRMLKHFYTDGVDQGGIPVSSYARLNRAVGLVECVKTEFERRVVGPYENQKEFENGSVN